MATDQTWQEFLRSFAQVRAVIPSVGVEMRAGEGGDLGVMSGHFSVFDVWYEINSMFEGNFLERVAPGAFKKTIAESRQNMKVLFDHGMDPSIGNKVLGPIRDLREDSRGAYYEVPLFDTSYNRDLLPGLQAGVYGASFRFRVMKDQWEDEPARSEHNPDGIPERTILETRTMEFGAVTFPASDAATAGVRSMTDEFYDRLRSRNPDEYEQLLARSREICTPNVGAAAGTPADGAARTSTDEPAPATRRTTKDAMQVVRRLDLITQSREEAA